MQELTQPLCGEGRSRWSSNERISSIGPAGVANWHRGVSDRPPTFENVTATLPRSCATLSDMRPERRDFMKCGALSVLGLAGERALEAVPFAPNIAMPSRLSDRSAGRDLSVIGSYGSWAASLNGGRLPSFSFRNKRFGDVAEYASRSSHGSYHTDDRPKHSFLDH